MGAERPAAAERVRQAIDGTRAMLEWRLDDIEDRERWYRQHVRPETDEERRRCLEDEARRPMTTGGLPPSSGLPVIRRAEAFLFARLGPL